MIHKGLLTSALLVFVGAVQAEGLIPPGVDALDINMFINSSTPVKTIEGPQSCNRHPFTYSF